MPIIDATPTTPKNSKQRAEERIEGIKKFKDVVVKADAFCTTTAIGAHAGLLTPAAPFAALYIGKMMVAKLAIKGIKFGCDVMTAQAMIQGARP